MKTSLYILFIWILDYLVPLELIHKHMLLTFLEVKSPVWKTETTLDSTTDNLICRISLIEGLENEERILR